MTGFMLLIILGLLSEGRIGSTADSRTKKLDPSLDDFYSKNASGTKNVIVEFTDSPETILNTFEFGKFSTEDDLHRAYTSELQLMQKVSQDEVMDFLGRKGLKFKTFWLTNQLFVPAATKELLYNLGNFAKVANIREEKMFFIHKPVDEGHIDEMSLNKSGVTVLATEWNIEKIHAPSCWGSTTGEGIRVGIIDTGIRDSHEAFKAPCEAFLDAVNGKDDPYDDQGHGTHVAGTIAGITGIGVAPGVTLVICKACDKQGACPESKLTTCCQFMTEKKPDIVSNSWGGKSGSATYKNTITSWKNLGMITVFSAGNSGPSCTTVGSPADYDNVISVGSTTSTDGLSDFSSRGLCVNGKIAPTISAPGSNIKSAWMTSDSAYKTISGTSMAAPHVSGMLALMKEANNKLTVDQMISILIKTAVSDGLEDPGQTCGGTKFTQRPNNLYGSGRINCAAAVQFVRNMKS